MQCQLTDGWGVDRVGQDRAGGFFQEISRLTIKSGFKNRDQLEKGGNKIKSLKHTHTH